MLTLPKLRDAASPRSPLTKLLGTRLKQFEKTGHIRYLLAAVACFSNGDKHAVLIFVAGLGENAVAGRHFQHMVTEQLFKQQASKSHMQAWSDAFSETLALCRCTVQDIAVFRGYRERIERALRGGGITLIDPEQLPLADVN